MALIVKDRVRENSTTTGTGTLTLSGAVTGYQTFFSAIGATNTTYYAISNPGTSEWEVGIGTVGSGTLSRDTVLASSNAGSLVSFTAGTKDVFVTYPAGKSVYQDASGVVSFASNPVLSGGTANGVLYLNASKSATSGSALVFDGTNLGIGTVSPSTKLHLQDNSAVYIQITDVGDGASRIGQNGTALTFGVDSADGSTERMRITSSGNVGIGTSSPGQRLDVSDTTAVFRLTSTTGTNYVLTTLQNTGGALRVGAEGSSGGSLLTGSSAYSGIVGTTGAYPLAFGANSIERMRIDSSGNVGIGTASPGAKLDVAGSVYIGDGSTNTELRLIGDSAAATGAFITLWKDATRTQIIGQESVILGGSNTSNDLMFYNAVSAGFKWNIGSGTPSMILDSSGNLGLGVTPSAASLPTFENLYGLFTGQSQMNISTNAYYNGGWKYQGTGYATRYYVDRAGGSHIWYQAPSGTAGNAISFTQAMTLDASGNLGIGTASPAAKLHVRTATTGDVTAAIFTDGTSDTGYIGTRSAGGIGIWAGGFLGFGTGSGTYTERMRIDSSGNVGIGVTPTTKLDVSGTSRYTFNVANAYTLQTSLNAAGSAFADDYKNALSHIWQTSGTEQMRIDSSGNVLLGGTATPASATASLAIFNGTAPTGSVTNGIVLYAEDVSSSSELKVRDEAGNVTTLSPHNFSLIPDGPSEDMAWAYYSERNGKRINVDMLKLARMIEKLTGEKLVYED